MLGIIQYIVAVEVPDDIAMNDMLEQLAAYTDEGYWPVVCWRGFVSFLVDG